MENNSLIKTKTRKPYKVSKFISLDLLLSQEEFSHLLQELGEVFFFPVGNILYQEPYLLSKEEVMKKYDSYIKGLEGEGEIFFPALCLTGDKDAVYLLEVGNGVTIQYQSPVIQIVEHRFMITSDFRLQSMCFGQDAIAFGLRFSFPSLFIDLETNEVVHLFTEKERTNTMLFCKIQKWMRDYTRPVKIEKEGHTMRGTFRLGITFKEKISLHAFLEKQGINL